MRRCYSVRRYAENEPQGASRGCLPWAFPQRGASGGSAAIPTRHPQRVPNGSRTNRSHRAGYTLVFFAMLMFALMGLAALVIDLGFARLTQRQMQTAVDSAAVEGLRGKGTKSDADRQDAAREIAGWHFDDDLDAAFDDGAFETGSGQFGAGPIVDFTGGAGDPALVASQTMSVDPDNPVYKPVFLDGTLSPSGFQVAMLRGGTGIPDADVYSVGPSLPYLFARGSMINRQLVQAGITVRATGVAGAEPVLSVGLPDESASPPLPGLAQFALRLSYWNTLTPGIPDTPRIVSGGVVTDTPMDRGRFYSIGGADLMPVAIGRTLPTASSLDDGEYRGYVPLYVEISGGVDVTDRIVAFGLATAEVASLGTEVTITRGLNQTVAENSSGIVCYPVTLTEAQWEIVFDTNKTLYPSAIDDPTDSRFAGTLLAPVSGK